MECLYLNTSHDVGESCILDSEEFRHARALRLRESDAILLTNGMGFVYLARIIQFNKTELACRILEVYPQMGESQRYLHAFIALIESKDRLEFCIEKCIELGVSEFTFIYSRYSSRRTLNMERIRGKSIATIKQCKRAVLPKFNPTINIDTIGKRLTGYDVLLADENGSKIEHIRQGFKTAFIIGPEGGFAEEEIEFMKSINGIQLVNLGERRLRAETAAITMSALCMI